MKGKDCVNKAINITGTKLLLILNTVVNMMTWSRH